MCEQCLVDYYAFGDTPCSDCTRLRAEEAVKWLLDD